MIKNVQT